MHALDVLERSSPQRHCPMVRRLAVKKFDDQGIFIVNVRGLRLLYKPIYLSAVVGTKLES